MSAHGSTPVNRNELGELPLLTLCGSAASRSIRQRLANLRAPAALACSQRRATPFFQWPGPRPRVTITKTRSGRAVQCWVMNAPPTQRTTIEKAKSRAGGRCSVFHDGLSGCAPAERRDGFRFIVILSLAAFLAACETTVPPDQRIAEISPEFSDLIISDVKVDTGQSPAGKTRWRPGPRQNSFVMGEGNIAFFYMKVSNIKSGTTHTHYWKFYTPNNKLHWRSVKRTTELTYSSWNFYNTFRLDPALGLPTGLWRVEFEFDGSVVKQATFELSGR